MTDTLSSPPVRVRYRDLAALFLKMSVQSFGGPVAHIAMGEDEIVRRRGWLTRDEYLDMVAASNLIPGPNSTEVMIHVGHKTRGIPGAVLAGACFIGPAFLITLVLAVLYASYGTVPSVASLLWGIQPVIVAIIAVAAYRLAPGALRNRTLILLFTLTLVVSAFGRVPEVILMLGAGLVYAAYRLARPPGMAALLGLFLAPAAQAAASPVTPTVLQVFWEFLKIGSVLFGSGYVLVSYLQNDIVDRLGWITQQQLLDAVAIGQFTPGPVLTTATVVGYLIGGLPAAIAATVGIFLPAFVLVILTAPLIPKMRASRFWSAFLDGVNAAVLAVIIVTVVRLIGTAFHPLTPGQLDIAGLSLAAVALGLITGIGIARFRINATWFIILGAATGLLLGAVAA